jgi:hypothetical protein
MTPMIFGQRESQRVHVTDYLSRSDAVNMCVPSVLDHSFDTPVKSIRLSHCSDKIRELGTPFLC